VYTSGKDIKAIHISKQKQILVLCSGPILLEITGDTAMVEKVLWVVETKNTSGPAQIYK